MTSYLPTATQLANLFHAQQKLDDKIEKKLPRGDEDRLQLKVLALLTEIGEALNEYRAFKFWSEDREPRTDKLLEEIVDILHFLLSIGIEAGHTAPRIAKSGKVLDPLDAFGAMYSGAIYLDICRIEADGIEYHDFDIAFDDYYKLIEALGFTWSDIEQAYNRKNEKNHTRQETAY